MPGGIGNHAYCLAKELSDLKYAVTVLTEQREEKLGDWQEFVESNTNINIIGIYRTRVVFLTYILRLVYTLKLLLQGSYIAVIYSGKFPLWLNGIMPKKKSIAVIHGGEISQNGFLKRLFKKGLQKATYIVCVSNYTKKQLISRYEDIDINKVVVINNGFKNDWIVDNLVERKLETSKLNLVTVGGIHKRKGQFNVVRALPNIIKYFPETEYHIIGLPAEKDKLLNLINNEAIADRVSFYHGLNDEQVKNFLKSFHVFMMLSEQVESGDFEGFGIAAMEAMALGLPAIGTQTSGIADAIKDGYSGKLVNPQNADEVLHALIEIINNYSWFSKNAKNWAYGFQWKYKVVEYQSLINKL